MRLIQFEFSSQKKSLTFWWQWQIHRSSPFPKHKTAHLHSLNLATQTNEFSALQRKRPNEIHCNVQKIHFQNTHFKIISVNSVGNVARYKLKAGTFLHVSSKSCKQVLHLIVYGTTWSTEKIHIFRFVSRIFTFDSLSQPLCIFRIVFFSYKLVLLFHLNERVKICIWGFTEYKAKTFVFSCPISIYSLDL